MPANVRKFAPLLAGLALAGPSAQAAAWSDNFNDGSITDGNPVPWRTNPGTFFPGSYNPTSGDLELSAPGVSSQDPLIAWVPAPQFQNTFVRTRAIVRPHPTQPSAPRGKLFLLARFDPDFLTGYMLQFDADGDLLLRVLLGGDITNVDSAHLAFDAADEVMLEFNVVGTQLRGFAWRVDDPNGKPAAPQVAFNFDAFSSGAAGVGFTEDGVDGARGLFRQVMAQDAPFPAPSLGDFDDDGDVDGRDFLTWQRGFGRTGQPNGSTGDADSDGDVDGVDFTLWKRRFGEPAAASAITPVPEPGSIALATALLIACKLRPSRSR